MGKRILVPGLILLLLAAGVSAWLVLGPQWRATPGREGDVGQAGAGRGDIYVAPTQDVRGGAKPLGNVSGREAAGAATGTSSGESSGANPGAGAKGRDLGNSSPDSSGAGSSSRKSGDSPTGQGAGPSTGPGQAKPAHSKERIIDAARPPNQTLGNARPVSRAIKTPVAKKLEDVSEKLKQDRRGLCAQYYAFQSEPLAELAKEDAKPLAQRDANLVRIDNQVHFPNNEAFADLPFDLANFAATWDGYLVIPEQGEYWLFLGADNAARVDLDGETVLLNDVQSRYIEVSTVLDLAPGLHPLRIEFAQGILANEDSWRCAASFMWVPKGQQKPVPVPPEMLMVPQWMWSDDAPIITKLERYEGEIGDEITIYGQGFADSGVAYEPEEGFASAPIPTGNPTVNFNGQRAKLLRVSPKELTVQVPIGASSGAVLVSRGCITNKGQIPNPGRDLVPSNSVDFKVTTQFGLMAQWYNFQGSPAPTYQDLQTRAPDVSRIEGNMRFGTRDEAPVPFSNEPLACVWEGYLGIPAAYGLQDDAFLAIHFDFDERYRITFDGVTCEQTPDESANYTSTEIGLGSGPERKVPLRIEWLAIRNSTVKPIRIRIRIDTIRVDGNDTPVLAWQDVRDCLLFPPATPPKPPRIASVIPMTIAGDEPPTPPFAAAPGLVRVREGQQFKCNVEIFGDEEVRAAPVTLSVDGHVIECGSGSLIEDGANRRWFRQFVGVLPAGCGEGKLTAKLGLSTSEPFCIDVANKGLIAYLYDLPNPSGYSQFPNILPLTCHTIRKEREINFGTADSFNLPFVAETFAVEWYGAIIIEHDGWYTFTSRTDDGCRVWLNGIEIIDDDNLHAPQEKSSERIRLVAGTYPFRMQFFENNQHEECLLFVAAVDLQEKELLARQVVPKRMFTWEVHDTLPDKIATGRRADGSE